MYVFFPTFSDARTRQARALAHNLETQPEQHTLMATPLEDRLKQQTGATGGRGPCMYVYVNVSMYVR